jgi:hypothetical protein
LPPMNIANEPVMKVINQNSPAILDMNRGDVSGIGWVIAAVLMFSLVSPQ